MSAQMMDYNKKLNRDLGLMQSEPDLTYMQDREQKKIMELKSQQRSNTSLQNTSAVTYQILAKELIEEEIKNDIIDQKINNVFTCKKSQAQCPPQNYNILPHMIQAPPQKSLQHSKSAKHISHKSGKKHPIKDIEESILATSFNKTQEEIRRKEGEGEREIKRLKNVLAENETTGSNARRLKRYDMNKVEGTELFEVCQKNFRNDDENLFIADYLHRNITYF